MPDSPRPCDIRDCRFEGIHPHLVIEGQHTESVYLCARHNAIAWPPTTSPLATIADDLRRLADDIDPEGPQRLRAALEHVLADTREWEGDLLITRDASALNDPRWPAPTEENP